MSQLMPLPLTVSCFRKIHIGFTFLVPAHHPGSPGKGPLNARARACVCVCGGCRRRRQRGDAPKPAPFATRNNSYRNVILAFGGGADVTGLLQPSSTTSPGEPPPPPPEHDDE